MMHACNNKRPTWKSVKWMRKSTNVGRANQK